MRPTVVLVGRPTSARARCSTASRARATRSCTTCRASTRDRHYGRGRLGDKPYIVVDTGGFEPVAKDGILSEMARQAQEAISEADVVIFVVDGRAGLAPQDKRIAKLLRERGAPVWLAVNKTEGMQESIVVAEFHELAMGEPHAISAEHGEGVRQLIEDALAPFKAEPEDAEAESDHPRVAIVGRPNGGKSTLVNRVLGEERMIAFDQPGTTRDAIEVEATWQGRPYTIVDTAGIRRKGKVWESVEKFSVVKTLQAIELANVVVLVVDASQDISEQDAHIGGYILEAGRALVVAVNKVDAIDAEKRNDTQIDLERKLAFLDFAEFVPISALQGTGLKALFKEVDGAFAAAMAKLSTRSSRGPCRRPSRSRPRRSPGACAQASLRPPGRLPTPRWWSSTAPASPPSRTATAATSRTRSSRSSSSRAHRFGSSCARAPTRTRARSAPTSPRARRPRTGATSGA